MTDKLEKLARFFRTPIKAIRASDAPFVYKRTTQLPTQNWSAPKTRRLEKLARAFLVFMALMFLSAWFWAHYGGSDELSAGAALGLVWTVFPLAIRNEK